ncbi:hypothetical protein AAF712_013138 [Marasmius tenuissimus]|uniref:Uncharacterized protein n=1 Tax=Marasmius tenuissimus TaxID=585030 RepID=A0ABR2ZEH8_9AGAR
MQLICESDAAPFPSLTETRFYESRDENIIEPPTSQHVYELEAITYSKDDFGPEDDLTIGLVESHDNLEKWMTAGGWTGLGFCYAGEKKLDFSIPYDYEVSVPVLFGEELITVPVTVRLWRRDYYLTERELRLYVNNNQSLNVLPTRYGGVQEPFTEKRFQKFAAHFWWDQSGFYEKSTGLPVSMGNGAFFFEATVREVYTLCYWRRWWKSWTAEQLAMRIMKKARLWIPDAVVYAEYFQENPPDVVPFCSLDPEAGL